MSFKINVMDIRLQIVGTLFLLLMLGLLIGAYIRQHRILTELRKAKKLREENRDKE
jgi:uncharacterized protein YneF (UPF0154 family)